MGTELGIGVKNNKFRAPFDQKNDLWGQIYHNMTDSSPQTPTAPQRETQHVIKPAFL